MTGSRRPSRKKWSFSTWIWPGMSWSGMPACRLAGLLPRPRPRPPLRLPEEDPASVDLPARSADLGAQIAAARRTARPADGHVPRRHRRVHPPRSGRCDPVGHHDDGVFGSVAPHQYRSRLAGQLLERPDQETSDRVRAGPGSGGRGTQRRHRLPSPQRQRDAGAERLLRTRGHRHSTQGGQAICGYIDDNRRGAKGRIPPYDIRRHFGVDPPEELRSTFAFYFDRFDVRPEI